MIDALVDPLRDEAFARGLIDVVAVAIVAGVVGTFIVLRGLGFLGDALAHSIFPGVVIAFLAGGDLLVGALVAALITSTLMGALTANTRVRDNTAIGVIFTAAFALGVVILTGRSVGADQLEEILFGDPLGASWRDVAMTIGVATVVVVAMAALRRLFVMAAFDPGGARAMGLPVVALDIMLLVVTALTVVIAFKSVGNILVISLMITPAATARLYTDRLGPMAALASVVAVAASIAGLYVGYHRNTSEGGAIVLIVTGIFLVSWLLSPRAGIVPMWLRLRDADLLRTPAEAEAEVILASPEISEIGAH